MKLGIIDVGSNSVRLMLWADGKTLYKTLKTTRLAEGLTVSGGISADASARTAEAIAEFAARVRAEGAERVCAFATEAVRAAANGREFARAAEAAAGVPLDVLTGEEEAEIGLLGALGSADGGLLDIGGGSSEITVRIGGEIVYAKSVPVGAVRLFDLCGQDRAALSRYISGKIGEFGEVPAMGVLTAIGGTATALASLDLGQRAYDAAEVTGHTLAAGRLGKLADMLLGKTLEERRALPGLDEKRAEIIGGGALLLLGIMEYCGVSFVRTSDEDNLEGYARRTEGV